MLQKLRYAKALPALIALVGLALAAAAAAGAEETGSLSLKEAIDVALKNHPAVRQARENMAAFRNQIGVSRAGYFPKVNFLGNYYYGNSFVSTGRLSGLTPATGGGLGGGSVSVPTVSNFFLYQFQANQLLYDFGKTPGLVEQSRASFHESEEDYSGTRQQVVLDVRSAYFGYLAAERTQKVQEETVRQNQELLKQAQGFYKVGLKAKIDVTKAEANLYQAQASLIQAKNNVALARVTLMNALGIKTWPYRGVQEILEVVPQPQSLEELTAMAMQQRPELMKNRYQQEFNLAGIRVARSGYFPTLNSVASYGWQAFNRPFDTNPSTWYVGAGVNFPLFEGLATTYAVSQNKAQLRSTQEGYEVLRQNILKEVSQAFLNVKTGWELIRATKKALEAARENLRLAFGRYQAGVGTIIEVTDAQVQFSQADLNFVQALYNYRVYEAQLDKAVGKPY